MKLSRLNIVLSVLLVLIVSATMMLRVDYSQPNYEFLPDMKYSPAKSAYSTNSDLPNGRTLQPPVGGTIARGDTPLHYTGTKEEAIRAGKELKNPFEIIAPDKLKQPKTDDKKLIDALAKQKAAAQANLRSSTQRGGEMFRIFCISCHGPSGKGDGPVAKRGFPPPPSLLTGKSRQMKDGQLFHVLSYGQGSMAPFAAQLSFTERWDVINHIRKLQSSSPQPQPTPESKKAEPKKVDPKKEAQQKPDNKKLPEKSNTESKPQGKKDAN